MGAEHSKSGKIYSYNLKYHPETWKVDMNLSCARQVYLTVHGKQCSDGGGGGGKGVGHYNMKPKTVVHITVDDKMF